MNETKYAKGIYFNEKNDKSPDFVLGSVSVKVNDFTEFLKTLEQTDKGYVKLDLLQGSNGPYFKVNEWKPTNSKESEDFENEVF